MHPDSLSVEMNLGLVGGHIDSGFLHCEYLKLQVVADDIVEDSQTKLEVRCHTDVAG